MSQKKDKKIRRRIHQEVTARFGQELSLIREVFKPRPRWCPRWLWELGLKIYVKQGEFEFYPDGSENN